MRIQRPRSVRLVFVCVFGIIAAASLPPRCLASQRDKTNVLLIVVDEVNDWVGCLGGHPDAKTPNIDGLAKRGTLFTNAHCQAPLCIPSRASLWSGRYPHSTGVYLETAANMLADDRQFIDGHLLPQAFAKHGYQTYGTGKLTHGFPLQRVFKTTVRSGNQTSQSQPDQADNSRQTNARSAASSVIKFENDWGYFHDDHAELYKGHAVDWACERLRQPAKQPFFLAVGLHPWDIPNQWLDLFPMQEITLPQISSDHLDDLPEIAKQIYGFPGSSKTKEFSEKDREFVLQITQMYLAYLALVDHQVGRVLEALRESGQADNTVVVLTSDHGMHVHEQHLLGPSLWERTTRVPLIIALPEQETGARCNAPVGLIDVSPTMLQLCDLPPNPQHEGDSLVPLLKDPQASWRPATLTTYGWGNHAVRSQRYRYICYEDGAEELYDHDTDPHECENLADAPEMKSVLREHRSWLPTTEAPYHPSTLTSYGGHHSWFQELFQRHGLTGDDADLPIFDGETLDNWMTGGAKAVPPGWQVEDGIIRLRRDSGPAGNIITRREYGDFELSFEWKVSERGNNGIKYRVRKYGNQWLGLEYQLLDDPKYVNGQPSGKGSTGSIYALYEPNLEKFLLPNDQYNHSRIVVRGRTLEHWLNGKLITSATVGDEQWEKRVAASKFSDKANFGRNRFGRIMITDHGGQAWFRNLRIEPLGSAGAPGDAATQIP